MGFASMKPPCLAGLKIYNEAQEEFEKIRKNHRTLAPTGCTAQFCQAGRATHINEPRVGRDRPLVEVQKEAADFLRECHDNGIIESPKELDRRIQDVLSQIESSAIDTKVTDENGLQYEGRAGGTWQQSQAELEFGLRASWRNARRCIMRSEYADLALVDLRHVKTSQAMADRIIDGIVKAFNGGRINPTVFAFPPRQPGTRGPMVWNSQILAFAGYQDDDDDDKILGDPASVELTRSIIDLGWKPPFPRTRWDILPLVTMAEGDAPYLTELPAELKRTIRITHPQFLKEFEELDLRWVVAPALSRLGFDVGGNQYTASPFIGWFMDSEIGVRNLADAHRYNVLPDVIKTLKLSNDERTDVEDLPEDERLLALSRAQAELNFAVHYSFRQEHVMISDSLTCSTKYLEFDQNRKSEVGYSLPADPFWLAPPQGSIVPIWHKGAAPNYQPKPMICRHVQHPVKAWNRQAPLDQQVAINPPRSGVEGGKNDSSLPHVVITWCSGGASANKMSRRLFKVLKETAQQAKTPFKVDRPEPLDTLHLEKFRSQDLILLIASTHGHGEIPFNGRDFAKRCKLLHLQDHAPKFAIFANGDSSYGDTYNAAAKMLQDLFRKVGCVPIHENYFSGDSAIHNPDWDSFDRWSGLISKHMLGSWEDPSDSSDSGAVTGDDSSMTSYEFTPVNVLSEKSSATLVNVRRRNQTGIVEVTLNVGNVKCQEMDHIRILSPNLTKEMMETLALLKLQPHDNLQWHDANAADFFGRAVDLEQPFKTLNWYPGFKKLSWLKKHDLRHSKINDVLRRMSGAIDSIMLEEICKDMQSIQPRIYSVASSPSKFSHQGTAEQLDLLVQVNPGGRFSDRWLSEAQPGSRIQFTAVAAPAWGMIQTQKETAPLIIVATGSGIAPVRAILHRRILDLKDKKQASQPSISLFVGCRKEDEELMREVAEPAQRAGLMKQFEVVPSNAEKVRVQDTLLLPKVRAHLVKDLAHPQAIVFVCANGKAAESTACKLSSIFGKDIRYMMQERYTSEIYDG